MQSVRFKAIKGRLMLGASTSLHWKRRILSLRQWAGYLSFGGRFPWIKSIFRRGFRSAVGVVEVEDFDGFAHISLDLSEHMQRRIFWMDYYNREIVALLDRVLKPGMVVVDVGANIGEISIVAARRVGDGGYVLAFEPMTVLAHVLEKNLSSNKLSSARVVQMGLSDTIGEFPIYSSCGQGDEGDIHEGLGSLYGDPARDKLVQVISVTTLDSYISGNPVRRLDVIKIDIEGAELPCLRGAMETLRKFKPLLIIEVQELSASIAGYESRDILRFLEPLGYEFYRIGRRGLLTQIGVDGLVDYQNIACIFPDGKQTQ